MSFACLALLLTLSGRFANAGVFVEWTMVVEMMAVESRVCDENT